MPGADPQPTAYDEFLDRLLGGEDVDAAAFLRTHPEIGDDEREQIRQIFARRSSNNAASEPTVGSGGSPGADAPPIAAIGGYRLKGRIGAGGMGAVFLAADESSDARSP